MNNKYLLVYLKKHDSYYILYDYINMIILHYDSYHVHTINLILTDKSGKRR